MNHQLASQQDREIVNAETAHQFHLNAIDHLEKALALHRKAVDSHDHGDFTASAKHAELAQVHIGHASDDTLGASKHYGEQMFYKRFVPQ
jgi:hypothetical protein